MAMRTLALLNVGLLALFALPAPLHADWLYDNWQQGSIPPSDWGTTSDPTGPPGPAHTARDIRAFAQFLLPPYIGDSFWDNYAALYAVTDRTNLFQAFRMDLKGEPSSTNYAEWYVIAIDGVPGEGITLGGMPGIDRVIASPWTGTQIGTPILFKWTGSGFDTGTPFDLIPNADWQYGYWSTSNPPTPPLGGEPGYGYTLEWKLPIGQLGPGPFTIAGATVSSLDLQSMTIYDQTAGINLGAGSIIPEPSSMVLLGLGALGVLGYLVRRRKG